MARDGTELTGQADMEILEGGDLETGSQPALWAVNLISDPIHGYIELTKPVSAERARRIGLPVEEATEGDLLDSAWLQRMRRISQLQSARWVFPTAEHTRFTHSLGAMHEAGLWARHLYPSLCRSLAAAQPPQDPPSEGLVVETLRLAGLLHDVGHGPFAHFFDEHVLQRHPAPSDPRRDGHKALTHEDLSQLIIEHELGDIIAAIRRAPGNVPDRDALGAGERIEPRWLSFLISKPALSDESMPLWLRWLQPLLSGVFTVDNLDYVRRDAYMIGVSAGPVEVERLRRYCFISSRGLSLYEPGLGALEMFLRARLFMYQQIYFHRSVRAIDLDMAEVFRPSIRAMFGEASPAEALGQYADLDEYALLHQAALWSRGEALSDEPTPGDGTVTPEAGRVWRTILLRQSRWRLDAELRRSYEAPERETARSSAAAALERGDVPDARIDIAEIDARPAEATATNSLLAVVGRDGRFGAPLSESLARLPAYSLIARRYVRAG